MYDVLERHVLEKALQIGSQRDPHGLKMHRRAVVFGLFGPEPPHVGKWPVEGSYDVRQGDVVAGSGQTVSAVRSALIRDQTRSAQITEDRAEESGR